MKNDLKADAKHKNQTMFFISLWWMIGFVYSQSNERRVHYRRNNHSLASAWVQQSSMGSIIRKDWNPFLLSPSSINPNERTKKTRNYDSRNHILFQQPMNESKESRSTPKFYFGNLGIVFTTAITSLFTVTILAFLGTWNYTNELILQDIKATVTTMILAAIFVKCVTFSSTQKKWLSSRDSRKIIHTLSAPLFIICWPLFSNCNGARYFAAIVPFINAVRLYIAGSSTQNDWKRTESELANAISRSGDNKEALGGPFIYVIVLLAAVLGFWHTSIIGIVSLSIMAAGDGMADIVGRRYGKNNKWFFNKEKSIAGSLAFILFSFITSIGLIKWLYYNQCLELPHLTMITLELRLATISIFSAFVELIPIGDDNWSVPLFAAFMTFALFYSAL